MKTETLTAGEIEKMNARPVILPMQGAVRDAQARSGVRLGVSVEQGVYHISAVAYAVKGGKVFGSADLRRIASVSSQDEVATFLNSWAA